MKNKRVMLIILTCIFLIIPLTFAQTLQNPDIDGSGEVDILDVLQVVNDFGKTAGFNPRVDLNNDGVINVLDILMIVSNWGAVPAHPPTINSFTASPQTINPGESSTLSWSVTGSGSFTLNPGNIDVIGTAQMAVTPPFTTTYNLTAVNSAGRDSKFLTVVKKGPNPHLKYFGYFGSHYIGPCDKPCTLEVADHSNVVHIHAGLNNLAQTASEFELAAQNGVGVIVSVEGNYYTWPDKVFNPNFLKQDWDELAAFLKPYESQIVALFASDEPYYDIYGQGSLIQKKKDELENISIALKTSFPDIPIAINFGAWIDDNLIIPQGYDWIGFDCYVNGVSDSWDSCHQHDYPPYLLNSPDYYFNILKTKKTLDQKIFLIPDGSYFFPRVEYTPQNDQRKVDIADKYYDMAKDNPEIIGMLPYVWAGYMDDGRLWTGTKDLPLLKARYNQIGKEISGK